MIVRYNKKVVKSDLY